MRHKLILGAAALLLPAASILSVGASPATARANGLGTGTFSCAKATGSLNFKPGLTLTPQNVTVSSKTVGTSCKGTAKPLPTSATATSSAVSKGLDCQVLSAGKPSMFKTTIAYVPAASPSTEIGTLTGAKTTPLSFTTKGVVTGSYASKTATSKGVIKQTVAQITASCMTKAGLTTLTVVSGSSSNE